MKTQVGGQLGVKTGCQHVSSARRDDGSVCQPGQYLDPWTDRLDQWCADEDGMERGVRRAGLGQRGNCQFGLETGSLPAKGIPADLYIHDAQMRGLVTDILRQQDHAGTGTLDRFASRGHSPNRLDQTVGAGELADRGTFAAGDDQPV